MRGPGAAREFTSRRLPADVLRKPDESVCSRRSELCHFYREAVAAWLREGRNRFAVDLSVNPLATQRSREARQRWAGGRNRFAVDPPPRARSGFLEGPPYNL